MGLSLSSEFFESCSQFTRDLPSFFLRDGRHRNSSSTKSCDFGEGPNLDLGFESSISKMSQSKLRRFEIASSIEQPLVLILAPEKLAMNSSSPGMIRTGIGLRKVYFFEANEERMVLNKRSFRTDTFLLFDECFSFAISFLRLLHTLYPGTRSPSGRG